MCVCARRREVKHGGGCHTEDRLQGAEPPRRAPRPKGTDKRADLAPGVCFQILYHRSWFRAVETARSGVNATLLVRQPGTGRLFVNFDPHVFELMAEARSMRRLHLDVPDSALVLCKMEHKLKEYHIG